MTPRPNHPTNSRTWRLQFTLRRMLNAIFMLGVAMGIGRWDYVRTILQRQVVAELQSMEVRFQYEALTKFQRTLSHAGFENDPAPFGYVVSHVTLHVPFRSDAEAARANLLLRRLPHLRTALVQISLDNYRMSEGQGRTNRHAATVIGGLEIRQLKFFLEPSAEWTNVVAELDQLEGVEFLLGEPTVADLRVVCRSPHLKSLGIGNADLTPEHFDVLLEARHLETLGLAGRMPCDRLGSFSTLASCELKLAPWNASDRDLEEVIAKLPNLTQLSLYLHEPSDAAVASLAGLPRLRQLSLQDAVVSDAAIAFLANSKSLEHVNLCGVDVSDAAILELASCPTLQQIEFLPYDRVERLRSLAPERVKIMYG